MSIERFVYCDICEKTYNINDIDKKEISDDEVYETCIFDCKCGNIGSFEYIEDKNKVYISVN